MIELVSEIYRNKKNYGVQKYWKKNYELNDDCIWKLFVLNTFSRIMWVDHHWNGLSNTTVHSLSYWLGEGNEIQNVEWFEVNFRSSVWIIWSPNVLFINHACGGANCVLPKIWQKIDVKAETKRRTPRTASLYFD